MSRPHFSKAAGPPKPVASKHQSCIKSSDYSFANTGGCCGADQPINRKYVDQYKFVKDYCSGNKVDCSNTFALPECKTGRCAARSASKAEIRKELKEGRKMHRDFTEYCRNMNE